MGEFWSIENPYYGTGRAVLKLPEYTMDKVGQTFHYTIAEINKTDQTVVYDDTVVDVYVTVTDLGKGMLGAVVTYSTGSEPVFTNGMQDSGLKISKEIAGAAG